MLRVPLWVPAFAAAVRAAVIAAGFAAVLIFGLRDGSPTTRDHDWQSLQNRWDAGWYVGIASGGYRPGVGGQYTNAAFFPAFPLLMRGTARLFRVPRTPDAWAWTGALLAAALFVAACCYLYALASLKRGAHPGAAVALCALYPFGPFFGACYTESLFLLASVAACYHLMRGHTAAAAAWGLAAGLSRPIGWLLVLPLGYIALTRPGGLRRRDLLAAASPAIGLAVFSAYLMTLTGNPLEWLAAQGRWGRRLDGLQDVSVRVQAHGVVGFATRWTGDLLNAVAAIFALACAVPVWRRYGAGDALYVAIAIAAPLAFGGLTSVARFTSVLFPIFIWMSGALSPRARAILCVVFALGQLATAAMFYTWRPLF